MRTGFGSNNVDHCTRLCHASSVAALLEGVVPARGQRVGVIVSGGNVDLARYAGFLSGG